MSMSQWWFYNTPMVKLDKDEPGVYEFGNTEQEVVYVGSSSAVRTRLLQHLGSNDRCIIQQAQYYRIDYRGDYQQHERERYDVFVLHRGRPPWCNDRRP